ncbi:hypothetical protein K458DRAFT_412559, partial [Lentithecium fluviatile CBS 122367]
MEDTPYQHQSAQPHNHPYGSPPPNGAAPYQQYDSLPRWQPVPRSWDTGEAVNPEVLRALQNPALNQPPSAPSSSSQQARGQAHTEHQTSTINPSNPQLTYSALRYFSDRHKPTTSMDRWMGEDHRTGVWDGVEFVRRQEAEGRRD